jgi:sugar lactone lactonase YvrE
MVLLGKGLKNIFTLVLPHGGDKSTSRQAGAHVYRDQAPMISKTVLRNLAIAIPVVVALVVAVIYLQKGRMIEAEYNNHLTAAQNKFQQAQAIAPNDPAAAAGLMDEAEISLKEAEKIKVDQPEIAELRQQMAVMADQVGNVQRLYYLPQLRQYTDPGTQLNRIVVQGVELYVLDTGTDRIFHHRLDDPGETLLPDEEASLVLAARGKEVDDITVGDILDMVWMPTGGNRQTSDLVILNTTGLLEYNTSWGITTSALAGGELMSLPVAVASYFGNLYILDPSANRLLRYLPTADGYSAQPDNYFAADQPVDLSNAVDVAIDGAVYVLFKDGRLSKFESGQAVEFNITGLDKPLKNPVSIFTGPDEQVQYLYVADTGNQRIVQLEKDGRFVRQFKPRAGEDVSFANLQDIYVDEIGSRLYILDSNNLYIGNIPTETVE